MGSAAEARSRDARHSRMGGAALARLRDQGAHARPSRRISRTVRGERAGATASMCIGRRTPPSTTTSSTASSSDHGAKSLIKSKSMLTEECGFRHYMASVGIEVIETDLGERIQQLDNEDPSHVVVPAVHKLRTDVAAVFAKTHRHRPRQQRRTLSGGSATRGDPSADPRRRCRHDRLQLRRRRDRRRGRLHQRRQRRSLGQCAETAHRLDRHREGHPSARASGGVCAPVVAQRARLADHAIHLAFSRTAGGRRDAFRAGR